jgi:hypothetical protein
MKVNIRIKPNSAKGPLVELQPDGSLVVYVREVAVDGKANDALIKVLARYYNVSKTRVKIIYGTTSKYKLMEINGQI